MADSTIANLTDGVTADATDRLPVERSPFGAGTNRYITPTYIRTYIHGTYGTGVATALGVNVGSAGAFVTNGGALGTPSSGTLTNATGLPVGGISATGTPDSTTFLRGDGTWNAASGGATLDGITAATADEAGISNGDFNVRWNWQKTTNSETAFMFSESAASTNGTSTSGVPNQVLLRAATVAASTMSAFRVDVRANFLMAASPGTTALYFADGDSNNPVIAAASDIDTGMYFSSGVRLVKDGVQYLGAGVLSKLCVRSGTSTAPVMSDALQGNGNTGFYFPATNTFAICNATDGEWVRFLSREMYLTRGSADATAFAVSGRKARGTADSPTVITTGDDLLTISGFGYVGATGTYVEAAKITFDSTGTIADNSTGVGGIVRFSTRKVAGSVTERMTVDENETADETSILVSINGGAPVRVSKGAADSGGTGFAVLRIPN